MFNRAVPQGRSEGRGEASSVWSIELLGDVRTLLADVFNTLSEPERALREMRVERRVGKREVR